MVISTLSSKNQTTVGMECVKLLGLVAGVRFKQWVEGNRLILEPLPDVMSCYGSLKKPDQFGTMTPKEEEAAMEMAVAREVMGLEKDTW